MSSTLYSTSPSTGSGQRQTSQTVHYHSAPTTLPHHRGKRGADCAPVAIAVVAASKTRWDTLVVPCTFAPPCLSNPISECRFCCTQSHRPNRAGTKDGEAWGEMAVFVFRSGRPSSRQCSLDFFLTGRHCCHWMRDGHLPFALVVCCFCTMSSY